MPQTYSYGVWIVKPGREEDFVAGWRELAEWTAANAPGAGIARLLQDEQQPSRFISIGPWDDKRAIAASRSQLGFQERVGKLREMLETYTPANLGLRAEVAATPLLAKRSAWVDHVEERYGSS
ncbi:MAG: antibiotic biosynthesis monooxygenase [Actinobacteria bacterium]|nr:antibiotic biosynthesis monooxygenase [Actinomycetota bacterium]